VGFMEFEEFRDSEPGIVKNLVSNFEE